MGRVYARYEDSDERFLVRIECDRSDCRATIKPNPDIANSGWVKRGVSYGPGPGDFNEEYFCPDHNP